ncbi:hypothetical protein [Sulfurimonas sp.]|uniref:hypothetical protein n=1 Tax=Sulfurimonas sp. TaxID=2022749 RepID=UPI003D0CEE0A
MWLKQFKIAIIEKNVEKLEKLMGEVPSLQSKEELEEAIALLKEATDLVQGLKDSTAESMAQIKKNINFLKSTQEGRAHKLDIKS